MAADRRPPALLAVSDLLAMAADPRPPALLAVLLLLAKAADPRPPTLLATLFLLAMAADRRPPALLTTLFMLAMAADRRHLGMLAAEDRRFSVLRMRRAHTCLTDGPLLYIVAQFPAIPFPLGIAVWIHAPLCCESFRIPASPINRRGSALLA